MSTAGSVIGVGVSFLSRGIRATRPPTRIDVPCPRPSLTRIRCSSFRRLALTVASATSAPSSSSTNDAYLELLADKTKRVRELFHGGGFIPARGVEVYASPKTRGYRSRCRFAIARDDRGRLRYALFENGEVVMLGDDDADEDGDTDVFPWASEPIARVMPVLLDLLNDADGMPNASPLTTGLSAVGFLASRGGEVVVTLWNRIDTAGGDSGRQGTIPGDAEWNDDANALLTSLRTVGGVGVVTRRRRKTLVASDGVNHVWEPVTVQGETPGDIEIITGNPGMGPVDEVGTSSSGAGSRHLRYKQVEGAFSNPNGDVAEVTARWLHDACEDILLARNKRGLGSGSAPVSTLPWLLELYCGNGNHAVSLSPRFGRVLAVEIEPRLVAAANENFAVNGVANATVTALPAETFARARTGTGCRGLLDGDDVDQLLADAWRDGTVLVDPPRAGLDSDTLSLVAGFRSVLYVACDCAALARDLRSTLGETHEVRRMALFDHFPGSRFCEVVVWLEAKA